MATQVRGWIKDNVLSIIIGCMLTAFLVNYEVDRKETKQFREDMRSAFIEHERQISILYFSLISDPNLTPTQKDILREFYPGRGTIKTK